MSNLDTVKAITTNLRTVLAGLGLRLEEDGIGTDKTLVTTPICRLEYEGETFDDAFKQRASFREAGYAITVIFNERNPLTMKEKQQQWVHGIREGLTVDALNVGGLAVSKPVSAVITGEVSVQYEKPLSIVTYKMDVRYREV